MLGAASAALSFIGSPAGRLLLIALAFFAWGAYQRLDATADCEAAQLREELAESQRQLSIAQQIALEARSRADAAEKDIEELKGIADALTSEINAQGGGCALDSDTRDRLLRIR